MKHIAILDFGSQYTHLIARRVRELEVLANIYPTDISAKDLPKDVIGIILSGGPQSVYDKNSPQLDAEIFNLGLPILGLCYGHQLMAENLGGKVEPGKTKEYGRAELVKREDAVIFKNIESPTTVWMSHGDTVIKAPPGFKPIGSTNDCDIAAMTNNDKNFFGLQFHPEVRHTEQGMRMLENFVYKICQAKKNWSIESMVDDIVARIKKQVADKKVFLLVSGGVDSSVAFALLTRALGEKRVYGLYVDTGFMRLDESEEIQTNIEAAGFKNLHVLKAGEAFYKNLEGITDPEEKRKIIGQTFLDVKDKVAKKLKLDSDDWLLGQGTIYPDTIETGGTKHADTIKTHHNRVDAIQKLIAQGKVIEPIADFYKDEVRHIGHLVGLPDKMINRHPFPGPGLAIRIICRDVNQPSPSTSAQAMADKQPPASPAGRPPLKGGGALVLPIKSVGVQGDNRTYAHPLAVWGENDWEKLDKISIQVTNSSKEFNRVVLLLNLAKKAPRLKLSPDKKSLTPDRIKLLQKVDNIVHEIIKKEGLYDEIWQFPVVLAPVGDKYFESIILRPIVSQEAMTAHFYRMPHNILENMAGKILAAGKIDYVFYDITNKPPGTIEWE